MSVLLKRCAWLAVGAVLATALPGCGGGSGTANNSSDPTRGTLALTLTFPPQSNFATRAATKTQTRAAAKAHTKATGTGTNPATGIPVGSATLKVTLTDPTTGAQLAAPRLVNGPLTSGTLPSMVTINFPLVPVGPVRVSAQAYPDTNAAQNPLATGQADGTVAPLTTTTINVPLTVTAATVRALPTSISLLLPPPSMPLSDGTGGTTTPPTATITGSVLNSANQPVLFPLVYISNDPMIARVNYNPQNSGTATVTGLLPGNTTITVVEVNSGLMATVPVTVSFSTGQ